MDVKDASRAEKATESKGGLVVMLMFFEASDAFCLRFNHNTSTLTTLASTSFTTLALQRHCIW